MKILLPKINLDFILSKKNQIIFFLFIISNSNCQNNLHLKKIDSYLLNNEFDAAFQYAQKVKNKFEKGNEIDKAKYYFLYAKSFKNIASIDSAIVYLDKAESYYKRHRDLFNSSELIFEILSLKAEISRHLNNKDLALKYIYQAEKVFNANYNSDAIAYFKNRKMAILASFFFYHLDSIKKVKKIADELIENENRIKNKSIIAYTLNEIGYYEFTKSNNKEAERLLTEAFDYSQKYNLKQAKVDIAVNLGRFYQQRKANFYKAIVFHKIALKTAKEINNVNQMRNAAHNLRDCYGLATDYKTALKYADSINIFDAEIHLQENAFKLLEVEKKYNLINKETELKASKKNTNYLILILLILVLGFFFLVYFLNKLKKNNKQLFKLNKENEFLVSETNHRINNSLQIINALIFNELEKIENVENSLSIKKIISKIESVATLHRHLHQERNKSKVNIHNFLSEISENFNVILDENNIEHSYFIENKSISIDKAMYLGLLLTELYINSIKHAFSNLQSDKKIVFEIKEQENQLHFSYFDNGTSKKAPNLKPKFVYKICEQINVNCSIQTQKGFLFSFNF